MRCVYGNGKRTLTRITQLTAQAHNMHACLMRANMDKLGDIAHADLISNIDRHILNSVRDSWVCGF